MSILSIVGSVPINVFKNIEEPLVLSIEIPFRFIFLFLMNCQKK